jgi:hypothetical protein
MGTWGNYLLFSREKNWKQLASYKMYKRDINEKKHIRRKEEEEDVGRKTN